MDTVNWKLWVQGFHWLQWMQWVHWAHWLQWRQRLPCVQCTGCRTCTTNPASSFSVQTYESPTITIGHGELEAVVAGRPLAAVGAVGAWLQRRQCLPCVQRTGCRACSALDAARMMRGDCCSSAMESGVLLQIEVVQADSTACIGSCGCSGSIGCSGCSGYIGRSCCSGCSGCNGGTSLSGWV